MTETKRLGRGLEALLGPISREQAEASGALRELAVTAVRPNPFQPRTRVDEAALAELAASIEASGLLQPIVVRSSNDGYELIAGERRWRAVRQLGWATVPAVVKDDVDDQTLLTLALVENLQRDDLSPIDEAQGYRRLMEGFALSQADVARAVGRHRATVANLLRLLKLPDEVQTLVHEGKLSEGHARALLTLEPEALVRVAKRAVADGWSVREVESRVRADGRARRKEPRPLTAEGRRVEEALRRRLGTDVRIQAGRRGRGVLAVSYYSNDDLARVLEIILGEPFAG
jgi:ParB family chromosome partitioning protein